MILKDITWCDNKAAGLIRRIQLSAKGLKVGVLRSAPACRTEQQETDANSSSKAKNEKNKD